MIAREFRISRKKDFDIILKSKLKFYSNNFVLRFSKNELSKSRFCVVVSKKISKKAVIRNKIRRRVYEIIRLNYNKIKPGFDFMILVKLSVLELEYKDIERDLLYVFKKANILI
ncbi:MAG TPA: ribonuclease P protein component [bacterium]|nr:ribonuclease P protein component [bacterium]